jgi:aminopeptidase N
VGNEHPSLAVDFALAHEPQVLARLEVSSRWAFIPELAETSSDASLAEKVRAYVQASTPADARQPADAVIAGILYRARVRAERLPELEAWIRAQVPGRGFADLRSAVAQGKSAKPRPGTCVPPRSGRPRSCP